MFLFTKSHIKHNTLSYVPTILTITKPLNFASSIIVKMKKYLVHYVINKERLNRNKKYLVHYVINKERLNRNKILITNSYLLEMRSINPHASRMQGVHSTILATSQQSLYHLSYIPTITLPF